MNTFQAHESLADPSGWPIWVVWLLVIALIIATACAWAATRAYNDVNERLDNHRTAWAHLATMLPVLKRRDTFGDPYAGDGYYLIPDDREPIKIDIHRVITAGEQYEERAKYSKQHEDLRRLDKILRPLREDEDA